MWVVKRDGQDENVALIAAEDLSNLIETVYLLRSPSNAARLHESIERAKQRDTEGYAHLDPNLDNATQSLVQPTVR
jgi:PHD/YefM family antitoxin component YafN of YafNO toxin-antitoxin module